jgi:mono/diheme cytochrome c family protein
MQDASSATILVIMRLVKLLDVQRNLIFGIAFALIPAAVAAQNTAVAPAMIKTYCSSCHGGQGAAGRVSLDQLDPNRPAGDAETWERVVRQLRARTMPPMAAPRPDGKTYESAIAALTSALDSAATTTAAPLTDTELALRLAKLLWNGVPDEELRDAAAQGKLHDPQTLQPQVRRMLADSKSAAFVTEFFDTWLSLDQLSATKADNTLFPEFNEELRRDLRRETELFVESQLRDDRNPLDLWTANYTFLNERLARHYGIPNVAGPEYRRVSWPGPERAGLLGQGSILTLTSRAYGAYPVDIPTTSPATRAKWILTRFLGVNPPTPLPNIPPKDFPFEKQSPLAKQSRTFPATPCLACHQSFFPLSYGLENFDVLGRWRSDYNSGSIDASGTMVDGTTFNGPVELRRALLERRDTFLSTVAERLMAFSMDGKPAVNKPTPASRMPAIRAALREAEAGGLSWSALITAIVTK